MAELFNLSSQRWESIPDEEVNARLAAGTHVLPKGRVEVLDDLGRRGSIDALEAPQAVAGRGYRILTSKQLEEERLQGKYGDRTGSALAAGLARGATLGASDVLLTRSGLVSPETLRELDKRNTEASIGGEIAGSILPALLPGGQAAPAGAVARLGLTVGKQVGGSLARRAAVSAMVEGGFQGLGHAITEDALGRADATAEKVLADVGVGALLGLGTGYGTVKGAQKLRSLFGAADEVVDDAARAAEEVARPAPRAVEALEEATQPGTVTAKTRAAPETQAVIDEAEPTLTATQPAGPDAEPTLIDELGAGGPTPRAAPPEGSAPDPVRAFDEVLADDQLGDKLRGQLKEGVERNAGRVRRLFEALELDWPTPENWVLRDLDIQRAAKQRLRMKGQEVSAPRALLEDPRYEKAVSLEDKVRLLGQKRQEAAEEIGQAVRRFDEVAQPEDLFNPQEVAARARKELLAPLQRGPALGEGIATKIEKELERLEGMGERLSFQQAEEIKRGYDPFIRWDSAEPGPVQEALRKLRGMINAGIEEKVSALSRKVKGSEELLSPWKRAKRLYGDMSELEQMAEKRLSARESNRFISLTDNIAGAAGFLAGGGPSPTGLLFGAAGAILNKWGRERLPQLLALHMHRARTIGGVGAGARALRKIVQEATEKTPAAGAAPFGPFTEALRRAAQTGEAELWALHGALSADEGYRETMQAAGLNYSSEADKGAAARARGVSSLESSAMRTQERARKAVDGFLKGARGKIQAISPKETLERAEQIARLADNPTGLLDQVAERTAPLGNLTPQTAAQLGEAARRAVAFLREKAPQPPPAPIDVPALRKPFRPDDAELERFARYVSAVENPIGVLESMAAGTITQEAVEALRAVYPALHEELRNTVLERLASFRGSRLDYRQRLSLGHLLGESLEESATPEALAFYQAGFTPEEASASRKPSGVRSSRRIEGELSESARLSNRRSLMS
jgi:hypothetical protein